MAIEAETHLSVDAHRLDQIKEDLMRLSRLGAYSIIATGTKEHTDTYFDSDERLYREKWSLRLRETGSDLRVTLKRPMLRGQGRSTMRDELESSRDGAFADLLERISALLAESGMVRNPPDDLRMRLLRDGAFSTLRSLGLREIFTIQTERATWRAIGASGEDIAEITLDNSTYSIGESASINEARLEIELIDSTRQSDLHELTRIVSTRFNAKVALDSKYERGVFLFRSRSLRDKMEAKITFNTREDYPTITRRIEHDTEFLFGYLFTQAPDRIFEDVYFDTRDHRLFEAGCYLRLRREGGSVELVFRRLTQAVMYGQVLQQEIVINGNESVSPNSWQILYRRLKLISNILEVSVPKTGDQLESAVFRMGLLRSLEASINRKAWIVERRREGQEPVHVAKLKYDEIVFRRPGKVGEPAEATEFEVTGVEGDEAAPSRLVRDAYHAFLAEFVEACAHSVSNGEVKQKISAKYFEGLGSLGMTQNLPVWLTDGRLGLRITLAREPELAVAETFRTRWAAIRFWSALATMIAGLFAMSNGSDEGLFPVDGAHPSLWPIVMQALGFLAVGGGTVYLFNSPHKTLSVKSRIVIVVGSLISAIAISIPWFGRHASADVVALLGVLPLLVSLARNGLGQSDP